MAFLVDGGGVTCRTPPSTFWDGLYEWWDVIVRLTRATGSGKYKPVTPTALKEILVTAGLLGIKVLPLPGKVIIAGILIGMFALEVACFLKWEKEQFS